MHPKLSTLYCTRDTWLRPRHLPLVTCHFLLLLLLLNCASPPTHDTWTKAVSHKNLGLAYLDRNDFDQAIKEFETVISLLPDEPLGYANLAVTYLKMQDAEKALALSNEALKRGPEDAEILAIQVDVLQARGDTDLASETLKKSVALNNTNVLLRYKYVSALRRLRDPENQLAEIVSHLEAILSYDPDNLAMLSESGEARIRLGQFDRAAGDYARIARLLTPVPEALQPYLEATKTALGRQDAAEAGKQARILDNLMKIDPTYRSSRDALGDPSQQSPPMQDFRTAPLDLAQKVAAAMVDLKFTETTGEVTVALSGKSLPWHDLALADYDADGRPDLALAHRDGITLLHNTDGGWQDISESAGTAHIAGSRRMAFGDMDNDGDMDLFTMGDTSDRVYHYDQAMKSFVQVRLESPLKDQSGGHQQPLFADYDHDGDLDILSSDYHTMRFYRQTEIGQYENVTTDLGFRTLPPKAALQTGSVLPPGRQPLAYGDFDLDGALDVVAAIEGGSHRLYRNRRQGRWVDWTTRFGMVSQEGVTSVVSGDFNNDGAIDLFMVGTGPAACRILWNERGRRFDTDSTPTSLKTICAGLHAVMAQPVDFDNDGFLDIVVAGEPESSGSSLRLIRNLGQGRFEEASHLLPAISSALTALAVADIDTDGDMDLVALSSEGLHVMRNDGGNTNRWVDIQLAAALKGSSKNNFYGIGSTIEARTETHYQSLLVNSAVTHIGLGQYDHADVLRVLWSNGIPQNRINPETYTRIVEEQRLKGSCPSLYTWNGDRYVFVTHLMTRSAIGALTETGAPAYPDAAADYVKIRGDQMQPQNGKFVIHVVEELWDAVYLDQMHLLAVDHPSSSDIYVDEKYVPPPYPEMAIYTATAPRLPIAAYDHHGHNILLQLTARDSLYAGDFALGTYQGVPEKQTITLDLGDLKGAKKIQLYLGGWIMPVEPSSNLALSQQKNAQVTAPYLEVPDAKGQWQTVIPYTGFPSGEHKTMVIDLTDKFLTDDYRLRITTNLQLYWSEAFFTVDEPVDIPTGVTRMNPIAADLHYRGFSREYQVTRYGPFLRDYQVLSTAPQWLPFEGYRTRYGDVTSLLQDADDQYAIYSSGEEVTVTFDAGALPDLSAGWTRDYILYSDGWLKEGDLNTATAATIEPLPFHGMPAYPYEPHVRFPESTSHSNYRDAYNTRWMSQRKFRQEIRAFGDALQVVDK